MGGGKSRALCEDVLEDALAYPGLKTLVARQAHTSITETTRKTMVEQVMPPELVRRAIDSGGRDFLELKNGSVIHFIGLDDPVKWFSSEVGKLVFDEAHEIPESAVVTLNSRLRQRCKACVKASEKTCTHYPYTITLGFNPENPGHWLRRWFILGATPTRWGYYKAELYPTDATRPIGDCEFFFAKATENIYLDPGYIERNLGGLPEMLRRRYLDGEWIYTKGQKFFDPDALAHYQDQTGKPIRACVTEGNPSGADRKDRIRFRPVADREMGGWWVWKPPIRHVPEQEVEPHRYVISIDVSSGTSNDFSAIQVLDVEAFEQVAEYQGKLDMDQLAVEAFRAAVVYNGALLAPEVTGGWGFAVDEKIEKLLHRYRGPQTGKPKRYTRPVLDRLSKKFTDRTGWDTNVRTRALMLDTLEAAIREGELVLHSERLHDELTTFVWPSPGDKSQSGPYRGVPQAQPGCNDDLVMALAIAVAVTLERPRHLRKLRPVVHRPQIAATGY